LKHTRLCASKGPELLRVKGSLRNEIISLASFIESVGDIAAGGRKPLRARGRSTTDDHRPERYHYEGCHGEHGSRWDGRKCNCCGRQDCCWSDSFHHQDRYGTDDQNRSSHRHSGFHPCHFTRASQQASGRATDTTRES
jgi:hypothetical protein